jgi:RNA polymerase sigma-70 factor (ECF subfamily)
MKELKPRERELLWLAYVEGSSHREIAQLSGLREQSVRGLLFRARARLAALLRRRGLAPEEAQR